MTKVCWVQHASEWPLFEQLARSLKKRGIDSVFMCVGLDAHKAYQKDGFESYFMSDIFKITDKMTQEQLTKLDLTYGPPGIVAIGASDVRLAHLFDKQQDKKDQIIGWAYKYWEDFLDRHNIDYMIVRETATFATRTAYNVSRSRGIPVATINFGPGEEYFVMNDVGESYVWKEFLEEISNGPRVLSQNEKDAVEKFIEERIQPNKKRELSFQPQSLLGTIRRILAKQIRGPLIYRKIDPIKFGAFRFAQKRLFRGIIWKYITQTFSIYTPYAKLKKDERFVYFPFYWQDEQDYLTSAYYFTKNEVSLVVEVASSLPSGFFLYVKGHPITGDFTYRDLKKLQKYPNIRLIHPSVSSQELIEKSEASVVVIGSVGWEAFLSKKPVICLGSSYYSYSPLIYKVRSIADLPEVLWKAIRAGSRIYDEREEEWRWFIHAVISTCGKGKSVRTYPPYGFPDDEENAELMSDFISRKIFRDLESKRNKSEV